MTYTVDKSGDKIRITGNANLYRGKTKIKVRNSTVTMDPNEYYGYEIYSVKSSKTPWKIFKFFWGWIVMTLVAAFVVSLLLGAFASFMEIMVPLFNEQGFKDGWFGYIIYSVVIGLVIHVIMIAKKEDNESDKEE